MTLSEANRLLAIAPASTTMPARINRQMTQQQAVEIVSNGLRVLENGQLNDLSEKRVWQVVCNQKRPSPIAIATAEAKAAKETA